MARLDDLLKIDGAVAAGEFAPDGTLVDFKSNMNMSRELARQRPSSAPRCPCCSTRLRVRIRSSVECGGCRSRAGRIPAGT